MMLPTRLMSTVTGMLPARADECCDAPQARTYARVQQLRLRASVDATCGLLSNWLVRWCVLCGRHELPPLQMGSLCISPDELLNELGVLTEGDFEALCRMEITFKRKKGEYFACYEFGTAITVDSDQMVRIGTLAMIRLLLRCGSFRACYKKLDDEAPERAAALRAKVADPRGLAGLEIEDTGYESFAELVAACRADGWVLDEAALDRPLFPGIDEATGCFLFTETFEVERLCKWLIKAGRTLGMNKHKVGAWSFRKDACEQPAAAGDGEVAARVLGHRHVNSRTMDRVYRADLRTRDLGAYWMRREALESVEKRPLTSLSAARVPAAGGVCGFADVPPGVERNAVLNDASEATAAQEVASAQRMLEARLGVAHGDLPRHFKKRAREADFGSEVDTYEAAMTKRYRAKQSAKDAAVEAYRLRVYKEGLEELRTTPALKVAMQSTHTWAARSENDAIAFGLERKDRTRELAMLRKLPAVLQGSILRVGALHVLPTSGTPRAVYERVRARCEAICSLRCGAESCADRADVSWPETAAQMEELRCEHCQSSVQLCWQRDSSEGLCAGERLAAGASALGASFVESYGVWYALCARATIGNAAYEAGVTATAGAPTVPPETEQPDEREKLVRGSATAAGRAVEEVDKGARRKALAAERAAKLVRGSEPVFVRLQVSRWARRTGYVQLTVKATQS